MAIRNFSNTAAGATITGDIAAGATSVSVSTTSGFPAAPFTATIARNLPTEESVLVTAVAGTTLTVTRGYDSTAAQAQVAGATFEHTALGVDFREANAHVNATTGVHGLTGAPIGTTDTQTLTNKTIQTLVALATASAVGLQIDVPSGSTQKQITGRLNAVEQWFVDYQGSATFRNVTGVAATFTGVAKGAGLESTVGVQLAEVADQAGTASKLTLWGKSDQGLYVREGTNAIRRVSTHWGTVAAVANYPAGALGGDTVYVTSLVSLMRFNGTSWRQEEPAEVANAAARLAIPTTSLGSGFRAHEADTSRVYEWTAGLALWVQVSGSTGAGIDLAFASGWSNWGSGYQNLRVSRTGGLVSLSGLIGNASAYNAPVTICLPGAIPVGFRPSGTVPYITSPGMNPSIAERVDVGSDGGILVYSNQAVPAVTYHAINITYPAGG